MLTRRPGRADHRSTRILLPGIVLLLQVCSPLGTMAAAPADDDCVYRCPSRPGPFGRPEPDKTCVTKCLQGETPPAGPGGGPAVPSPRASFRFTGAWDTTPARQRERGAVDRLVKAIPHEPFRRWVAAHVVFDRVSRGPVDFRAGVTPGRVSIYDPFWARDLTDTGRTNVLTFELAKALWFDRINPGAREERPRPVLDFEAVLERHRSTIEAMKFAALRGEDLAALTDRDEQSQFAYAARVVLFDLDAPTVQPPGYAPRAWADIQRDWRRARDDVRGYLTTILGAGR